MKPLAQETNPEYLRQAAVLLERENKRLVGLLLERELELMKLKGLPASELQLRLAEIERQLAMRNKALFGKSTEKRPTPDDAQQSLPTPTPTPPPPPGHGPTEQLALEVVPRIHLLDEADKVCPKCGGQLQLWSGQFEESELIDVVERKFVRLQVLRQKYRCGCQACVETALGPAMLIPGGRYTPEVAVEVAVGKYLDHLPLQRQVRIMEREGFVVTATTLWDQINAAATLLEPTFEAIHRYILAQPVIGTDETHWKFLGDNGGEHEQTRWQAWTLQVPDAAAYRIVPSRSAEAARTVLRDYRGIVMADGYGVYEHLAKHDGIILVNCWAHVRRKFIELEKVISGQTRDEILDLLGELFAVERQVAGDLEVLARLRDERSRPILARIREWLFAQKVKALPRSAFAKAVDYALVRWTGLTRFVDNARIPIDNNGSERALRGPVIGRKNHYGSKSQRGTEVAAIFYTLCETAKLAGVEPKAYLSAALRRAMDGAPVLLPREHLATLAAAGSTPA